MSLARIASATTLGIILAGSTCLWSNRATPDLKAAVRGVTVVKGTSPQGIEAGRSYMNGLATPQLSSSITPPVEKSAGIAPDNTVLQTLLPDAVLEPDALHERLRAQLRDAAWALRAESAIKGALGPIPYISPDDLSVSCGSTLCEIRGSMVKDLNAENAMVAMEALQGGTLQAPSATAGLRPATTSFSTSVGSRNFTIYMTRE